MNKLIFVAVIAITLLTANAAMACEGIHGVLGAGKNYGGADASSGWQDQNGVGCTYGVGYRWHHTGDVYSKLSYQHYSQCFTGRPFNSEPEDSSNHFYYSVEFY